MKRMCWIGIGLALMLTGCGKSVLQTPTVLQAEPTDPNLKVVMLDYYRRDAPLGVRDLEFEVRSDDPKVRIEQVLYKLGSAPPPAGRPTRLSLMLALDQSFSLRETDPQDKRFPAVRALIESLPTDARVGLLCFASLRPNYGDFDVIVPVMPNSRDALLQAVAQLERSDYTQWGTPLWNTLYGSAELLAGEPSGYRRQVFCFTDGQNETPDSVVSHSPDEVIQKAVRAGVTLSFVVLGDETTIPTYYETVATLERMAQATGGSVITVQEAEDLYQAFSEAGRALGREPCYRMHIRIVREGGYAQGKPVRLKVRALPNGVERAYEFDPETEQARPL